MNLRLYTSSEDSKNFSRSFSTKLYPKFERSTFLFVDFSINESRQEVLQIQVFYSENGFFYTKFNSDSLIRHAFGKWDALNFMLAKDKNKPLTPLFIFDFPLDNSKSPYDATFANVNGELHILSKIYNLSDEHFKILKKSYKLYKIEGADYSLFDFGNCFSFLEKFLKNLETVLDDVDFKLNDSNELIVNPISLDSIRKREDDYKFCMICGKKLEPTLNKNLLEISRKFPARCETCLKQIYSLELYYKLKEGSISTNMLSVSELEYIWSEEGLFEYNFKLLKDYGFLKPFSDDIYKLYLNEEINEVFNPLLNPIEEKEEESKSKSALDDYFGFNDDKEKSKCKICGEEIEDDDGTNICSNCFDKQMTIEKIHKLIEYVKPGTGFSKSYLIEKGFNHIDLDIIIDDLNDNDLLRYDSDDLIILSNRTKLNDFIRQYSDSDEYIIKIKEEEIPKLDIYDRDLKREDTLDKAINLIDYQHFVEFYYNHESSAWTLILKKEGKEFLSQDFISPFQAKLTAVRYLGEIDVINIIKDTKNQNQSSRQTKKNQQKRIESTKKYRKICPLCGKKFISSEEEGDIFCFSCQKKYNFIEKQALEGIVNGDFDKEFLNRVLSLKKEGLNDYEIAKSLNLKYRFLLESLIKFLSDDSLLKQIHDNIGESDKNEEDISEDTNLNDSLNSSEDFKIKKCPICYKEFKIIRDNNQKYCEECLWSFTPFERQVLVGINEGHYDRATAIKIRGLLNQGYPKLKVSKKLNLNNPSLIDPILKFLLPDNYELKEKNSKKDIKYKKCVICGKEIIHKDYATNRKFCDECKSKYKSAELRALEGIKKGKYTKKTADSIKKLKKEGKTNIQIAYVLGIPNPVVPCILKFFSSKYYPNSLPFTNDDKKDVTKVKVCPICKNTFEVNKKGIGQKYCNNCKKKFTPIELTVLLDIEKGTYTKETALEILKYKNEGKTNKQINNLLKLPHPGVISPILKLLLDKDEFNNYAQINTDDKYIKEEKMCPICYKKFTPKSSNGSDIYCPDCKGKFTPTEIQVLMGVLEGKYNTKLARRLEELKELGFTNTFISSEENVPLALINPVIHLLLDDDGKIEGISYNKKLSKWFVYGKNDNKYINLGFYETKEEAILAKNKYFKSLNEEDIFIDEDEINDENDLKIFEDKASWFVYYKDKLLGIFATKEKAYEYWNTYSDSINKDDVDYIKELFKNDKENSSNIVLNGIISEEDRLSIFNFISVFNVGLNKILCDKAKENYYKFLLDFDIDKSELENILINLKQLGWE